MQITLWHNYISFHFIALPTRVRRLINTGGNVLETEKQQKIMAGRHQLLWLASCLAAVHLAHGISESELYPFGLAAGDQILERSNDLSSPEIVLETQFTLFGQATNNLFVRRMHDF